MTTVNLTPVSHQVWNEFDKFGLLLGAPRLNLETNDRYKQRLFDVFIHRSNSSYLGLIYGITRELGYSLYESISIEPTDEALALGQPTIQFIDTRCIISSGLLTSNLELDRWEIDGGSYTLAELITSINASGVFTATLMTGVEENNRAMGIFEQENFELALLEDIVTPMQKLKNINIIENSISIVSNQITERVETYELLVQNNQYYIDTINGIFYSISSPEEGTKIKYRYRKNNFITTSSPIIISNLQSETFKKKLYLQENGENTILSQFGADIVNELLSVFPTGWGE